MPHIPEDVIEQIKQRADLVELVSQVTPVHQRGSDFWACCPFHHEKTPSFKINTERQSYYCFGCKKSGNAISFVKETVNTDFLGAIRWLAARLNIDIPEDSQPANAARRQWKDTCLKLLDDATLWYREQLQLPHAQLARSYIDSRELDQNAVNRFMLGYSPDGWDTFTVWARRHGYSDDHLVATGLAVRKEERASLYDRFRNRLMFPIWNELGRVVGFSARILEPDAKMAKYVNSPETDFFQKGQLLYAYHLARTAFKDAGRAIVCEGQLDVIACHRAGLTCAVAAQGTAFTEHHARMLKRSTSRVTLAFDADTAGQKATIRTVTLLHAQGLAVDVATLPPGDDPDGIFRKGGPQALNAMLAATTPALQFLLRQLQAAHDTTRPEELAAVVRQLLETIRPIADPVTRAAHCQWLANELHLPEDIVLQEMRLVDDNQRGQLGNRLQLQPPTLPSPPRQPGAPHPSRALPAFTLPVAHENIFQNLLEVILTSSELAERLANDETLTPQLPDNPLGHAISLVLAFAEQGEWNEAAADIAASKLAEYPPVGKALTQNQYAHLEPTASDDQERTLTKRQKLEQALSDCLNRLRRIDIDRQLRQLRQQMAELPQEQQQPLLQQMTKLIAQKKALATP